MLKSLDHPNIVRCLGQCQVSNYDNDGQERTLNVVMKPWQTNLEHLLEARKKFSPVEAVSIVKQILEGLDYFHGKNIVLRYFSYNTAYNTVHNNYQTIECKTCLYVCKLIEQIVLSLLYFRNIDLSNVMILTDQEDPDWNSVNTWEMQVKLGSFDHFKSVDELNNETGTRTRLPKDIWSRDPEEIEALLEKVKDWVGDYKDDLKSIGKLLYKLVAGTYIEGKLYLIITGKTIIPNKYFLLALHQD